MEDFIELPLPRKTYHIEALDAAMRSALGAKFYGLNGGSGGLAAILALNATLQDQSQILAIATAHDPTTKAPRQIVLDNIRATAQSAEGLLLTDLTAAQVKALLAALLYRAGAVANDGRVKPLAEWTR